MFVDTENPGQKRVVREIRDLNGVVRADALFGAPDITATVEGEDIADMDAVIDQIAELDGVVDTESRPPKATSTRNSMTRDHPPLRA
ncbi:MAG: Lrp/AsnC ligand binding domain-containing protein [Acidimicrobiales bacterium]